MSDGLLMEFLENIETLLDGLEVGEPIPYDVLDDMLYEVVVVRAALERKWTWNQTEHPEMQNSDEPIWEEDQCTSLLSMR